MKNVQRNRSHASNNNSSYNANYDSVEEKHIDDTLITVIQGLDLFIAKANNAKLGTMARILHNAKEELVYWAVDKGLHETAEEKFVNRMLYSHLV